MSANSSEGPGLDGKWFEEEEEEKNGMFGSAGPRFDEMRDDPHAPKQQFHPFEGSGVAMETASTGKFGLFIITHCMCVCLAATSVPAIKEKKKQKLMMMVNWR